MAAKAQLDATISKMLKASDTPQVISRRLFLYDKTDAFSHDQDRGFAVLNDVCNHFKVAFSAVRVVGSGHVGYSYFKNRGFVPRESDLDIAIISPVLFQKYSEHVYEATRGYSDQSAFPRKDDVSTVRSFREYLSAGFFRPDLMPTTLFKDGWFTYFNQLSNKYSDLFKSVNAGVYLSERFFELRNSNIVAAYKRVNR